MIKYIFTSADRPEYHESMLIIKIRPTAVQSRRAGARAAASLSETESPGLSILTAMERGGTIKRITPLAPEAERRGTRAAASFGVAAMVASSQPSESKDPNEGVHLVEMEKGSAVSDVQMRLANDPSVEFVSRVPVRYLLAKAPPARKASALSAAAAVPPPAATMWNLDKILWRQARALRGFKDATKIRDRKSTRLNSSH